MNYFRAAFLCFAVILTSMVAACTATQATRGNLLEDYQLKEILPGIDAREDVMRKVGSPTTISTFDENTWYYMGQKTEKKGILDPKVTAERIIVVTFAADGKVDAVKERMDGRQDIAIVDRATPASGNEFTFMQQMLGNLGKFNRDPENAATTAGGMNR